MGRKRVGAVGQGVGGEVVSAWLARTCHTLSVIARLDRAIQYSETAAIEPGSRSILDAPAPRAQLRTRRGMTASNAETRCAHIVRANMRNPGAPMIASNAGSRFSSAKTNPALA
ncbi:anti-sigma factor RsiW [Bradyrhizobium japonicum]